MERRKGQRFRGEIYFTFRTGSIFSKKETPILLVKDISTQGLSFIYPEALPFGKTLLINLYLPMYTTPVKVKTEVKKSEKLAEGQYKTGLEFIKISPEVQKNLEPHIYRSKQSREQGYYREY